MLQVGLSHKNVTRFLRTVFLTLILGMVVTPFFFSGCTKKEEPKVNYDSQDGSGSSGNLSESDLGDGKGGGKLGGQSLTGFTTIYFDYDSATLSTESRKMIEANAQKLKSNKNLYIVLEGNCDERGSTEYNLALGERRANSVRDYLATLGVSKKRLKTISFGEEKPVVPGSSESAYSKNRRVDFAGTK